MKYAIDGQGVKIEAEAGAPDKAVCPHCKGNVFLRMRRRNTKSGDVSYFWRHESHENSRCPARFKHSIIR